MTIFTPGQTVNYLTSGEIRPVTFMQYIPTEFNFAKIYDIYSGYYHTVGVDNLTPKPNCLTIKQNKYHYLINLVGYDDINSGKISIAISV